jgi:peptidoglycan/xylan/chitin deacetylase (PgdA/CDA1 family)
MTRAVLGRGVFTLSFDLELAWGEFHRSPTGAVNEDRLSRARAMTEPLLELLRRHCMPASFLVVAHLLLERCPGHGSDPDPHYQFGPARWYDAHPRSGEAEAPLWYARGLVERLREADARHDIGAHGYTHAMLGEPGATAELARNEFAMAARALRNMGWEAFSFVFPRNQINYLEILQEQGFRCFRDADSRWYGRVPGLIARPAHGLDQALGLTPPTGLPVREHGLWRLPSSMLFLSREGWRRFIPMRSRLRRALRGLQRAVQRREVFHLWLHFEDLVPGADRMLAGLEQVFKAAHGLRDQGRLDVLTMRELTEQVEGCASSA